MLEVSFLVGGAFNEFNGKRYGETSRLNDRSKRSKLNVL